MVLIPYDKWGEVTFASRLSFFALNSAIVYVYTGPTLVLTNDRLISPLILSFAAYNVHEISGMGFSIHEMNLIPNQSPQVNADTRLWICQNSLLKTSPTMASICTRHWEKIFEKFRLQNMSVFFECTLVERPLSQRQTYSWWIIGLVAPSC